MLAEAIAFIEELVSNSAGFKHGPDSDADDWRSLRNKIVADDGSVDYKGIEQVSGRHFQHVANNALQQDMFDAIVNDPTVHPATRAHFRSTKQLGAGAVLGIDVVHKDVELNDKAWLHEAQGYLNHPKGAITLATRCVGFVLNSHVFSRLCVEPHISCCRHLQSLAMLSFESGAAILRRGELDLGRGEPSGKGLPVPLRGMELNQQVGNPCRLGFGGPLQAGNLSFHTTPH